MICIQRVVTLDSPDVRILSRCSEMCDSPLEYNWIALYQLLKQNTACQKTICFEKISIKSLGSVFVLIARLYLCLKTQIL